MSLDDLQEKIAEYEDYVQSSDIAAMQSKHWMRFNCVLNMSLTSFARAVSCADCSFLGRHEMTAYFDEMFVQL